MMSSVRTGLAVFFTDTVVPAVFPRINPAFRWLLKSRLHWLASWYVVMICFPGRRTGRMYWVPVAFHRDREGVLEALTSPKGRWWRNLRGLATVNVVYRGRMRSAPIELVEDAAAKQFALSRRDWCRRFLTPLRPEQTVLIRLSISDSQSR